MSHLLDDAKGMFVALINDEEEFSIWPEQVEIPNGWKISAGPAPKDDCLKWISEQWIDMRPLSLRKINA